MLQFIGEGQLDFELQEVAKAAGIHRTTLFRRWPDRGTLIAEAMKEHVSSFHVEWTGDWRADLRQIAFTMRDFLTDPIEISMNQMMAASSNVDFRTHMLDYWAPIIKKLHEPVINAQKRGEISNRLDPVVLVWTLISPILVIAVFVRAPATDDFLNSLVEQTIQTCLMQ